MPNARTLVPTEWPDEVARRILGGESVLFLGEAGAGKSTAVRLASKQLELAGLHIIELRAEPEAGPLGLFEPLFAFDEASNVDRPSAAEIRNRLIADATAESAIVWVDSAQSIDAESVKFLSNLVRYTQVRAILTARADAVLPDGLALLVADGVLTELKMLPLGDEAIAELVRERLGPAQVDAGLLSRIQHSARGNPLYAHALIDALLQEGMTPERGMYSWNRKWPVRAPLHALLRPKFDLLTRTQSDAVAYVAAFGPVPERIVATAFGADTVASLINQCHLSVRSDRGHTQLQVEHPLIGEIARSSLRPCDIERVAATILDACEAQPQDDYVALRLLELYGPAMRVPDPSTIQRARSASMQLPGPEHFRIVANAIISFSSDESAVVAALVDRAELSLAAGEAEAAAADLENARPRFDHLPREISTVHIGIKWAMVKSDIAFRTRAGAQAMSEPLEFAIERTAHIPGVALGLQQALAGRQIFSGQLLEGAATIESILAVAPEAVTSEVLAAYFLVSAITGHEQRARHAMFAELHRSQSPGVPDLMRTGHIISSFVGIGAWTGRIQEAADYQASVWASLGTRELPSSSLQPLLIQDALIAAGEGRWRDAEQSAREACAHFSSNDHAGVMRFALSVLVHALSALQEYDQAAVVRGDLDRTLQGTNMALEPLALAQLAGAHTWSRGAHAACESLSFAAVCEQLGAVLPALRCVHSATLISGVALQEQFDRIERLAAQVDAPVAEVIVEHCRARLERDAAGTELAARSLARLGIWMPTAHVASTLTPREREIAAKAALGYSSKAIAAQMHLSPRTVETHLTHAFAKLGIDGRDDLGRALDLDGGLS